jgi:choline kinase
MYVIVPMAGDGERFKEAGMGPYKPFISILGESILERTVASVPDHLVTNYIFGIREDHNRLYSVKEKLQEIYPECLVVLLPRTKGNLETALMTCELARVPEDESVLFLDCDNPFYLEGVDNYISGKAPIKLCGFSNHELSDKWCYVNRVGGRVKSVHEKDPSSAGTMPLALIGFFHFETAQIFKELAHQVLEGDITTKGEAYMSLSIARALQQGIDVAVIDVDKFYPLGTPEDVRQTIENLY